MTHVAFVSFYTSKGNILLCTQHRDVCMARWWATKLQTVRIYCTVSAIDRKLIALNNALDNITMDGRFIGIGQEMNWTEAGDLRPFLIELYVYSMNKFDSRRV